MVCNVHVLILNCGFLLWQQPYYLDKATVDSFNDESICNFPTGDRLRMCVRPQNAHCERGVEFKDSKDFKDFHTTKDNTIELV